MVDSAGEGGRVMTDDSLLTEAVMVALVVLAIGYLVLTLSGG